MNSVNAILVPFLLALNASIPDKSTFKPEYIYNLNKTIVVFRDPLQTTEYNATVSCHFIEMDSLRCLLNNINIHSTLTYKNFNVTHEVTKEKLSSESWFQIKFNARGVERIVASDNSDTKDLIKEIAYQFSIGNDLKDRTRIESNDSSSDISGFIKEEKSIVGTCETSYVVIITSKNKDADEKKNSDFRIISSVLHLERYADQKHLHVSIQKNRNNCQYSSEFDAFLNGMEMAKYVHTMEIIDDKFKITTTMDVKLPADLWNPSGTPVFRETMMLDLTKIETLQTEKLNETYIWTDIN